CVCTYGFYQGADAGIAHPSPTNVGKELESAQESSVTNINRCPTVSQDNPQALTEPQPVVEQGVPLDGTSLSLRGGVRKYGTEQCRSRYETDASKRKTNEAKAGLERVSKRDPECNVTELSQPKPSLVVTVEEEQSSMSSSRVGSLEDVSVATTEESKRVDTLEGHEYINPQGVRFSRDVGQD
ncbi:unnamed protein product, partial [Timema podura]|nr:unnamed protein product [Timema podura]